MIRPTFLYIGTLLGALFLLLGTLEAQSVADTALISQKKFKKLMQQENAILIDVRTPEEFQKKHIPGAINMDVKSAEFPAMIAGLDTARTYLLYCRIGVRSGKATKILKDNGYPNVYHLKGGIEKWRGRKNVIGN